MEKLVPWLQDQVILKVATAMGYIPCCQKTTVCILKKKIRKAVSFSDSCISMHNWIPSPLYTRFSFSLSPRGSWKVSRQCSELAEKIMHGEV